jgi:hypothetical protein
MSGNEMKYIQEAFDQNWVVPLGPNVNKFEEELKRFVVSAAPRETAVEDYPQSIMPHEVDPEKLGRVSRRCPAQRQAGGGTGQRYGGCPSGSYRPRRESWR